ncbi:MAG: hypothetical protein EHM65_10660 [Acidobacteriales bacterium]|nr:MAG: hypothetical protein EHM65_10660 [Terriglobales bacterium]
MSGIDAPSFLKEDARQADEPAQSELEQLEELVSELQDVEADIARLEDELSARKAKRQVLGQDRIPTLLTQHGLSEVRLRSGKKVIVKEDASVSVPPDKRESFFAFLKDRDEEDIIKLQVAFGRMPQEKFEALFDFLNSYEYEYDQERNVHPSTLKKYFKELLGVGDENKAEGIANGRYMRKEDPRIQAIANVFTYFTTKLK